MGVTVASIDKLDGRYRSEYIDNLDGRHRNDHIDKQVNKAKYTSHILQFIQTLSISMVWSVFSRLYITITHSKLFDCIIDRRRITGGNRYVCNSHYYKHANLILLISICSHQVKRFLLKRNWTCFGTRYLELGHKNRKRTLNQMRAPYRIIALPTLIDEVVSLIIEALTHHNLWFNYNF